MKIPESVYLLFEINASKIYCTLSFYSVNKIKKNKLLVIIKFFSSSILWMVTFFSYPCRNTLCSRQKLLKIHLNFLYFKECGIELSRQQVRADVLRTNYIGEIMRRREIYSSSVCLVIV